MAYLFKVAILVAVATSTKAQFSSYQPQYEAQETREPSPRVLAVPELIRESHRVPTIALTLELPKINSPSVPFYNPEPSTYISPPNVNQEPQEGFFDYPAPAQDLRAPSLEAWNPNNDPNLYFEIIKSEEPTNFFPKKYSKDIHDKVKPISSKPKEEITLVPISPREFEYKQTKFDKTLLNLAKVNNQKLVQAEKVDKFRKLNTHQNHLQNHNQQYQKQNQNQQKSNEEKGLKAELATAATAFLEDGELQHLGAASFAPSQELHAGGSSSLGFHAAPSHSGDRVQYQMHGHAGPHSYKWGFDTGKGHNRHYRYEERDKHGVVKGQYGYYDKHGKLQVVNYDSHPHEGFHAEGNFGKY